MNPSLPTALLLEAQSKQTKKGDERTTPSDPQQPDLQPPALDDFPASSQSVSINDLKYILHTDMSNMITGVIATVKDLSVRVSPIENKISKVCIAHNYLIDSHKDPTDQC